MDDRAEAELKDAVAKYHQVDDSTWPQLFFNSASALSTIDHNGMIERKRN